MPQCALKIRNIFLFGIDMHSMGGSQRVFHLLAQGMSERGHRVEMISVWPSEEPFVYTQDPAYRQTTLFSRPAPSGPRPSGPLGLREALHKRGAKSRRETARVRVRQSLGAVDDGIVIIGSPWAADWLVPDDWQHLTMIGQYHQSYEQAAASVHLRLMRRHYQKLDKSLFLSLDDQRAFVRQRFPNTGVMPNPLSFFPERPATLERPRIVYVGRLDRVKRLDRMIEAFALARTGDWELHLIGEGSEAAALRELIAARGLTGSVVFRGSLSDVRSEYLEASVFALTSVNEGRPMALAEAAACGVPAVCFDVSAGLRELVDHERSGLLIPPGDVEAFASGLRELMGDAGLRRKLGTAARERVSVFSLERVLDRWEAVFDELDR